MRTTFALTIALSLTGLASAHAQDEDYPDPLAEDTDTDTEAGADSGDTAVEASASTGDAAPSTIGIGVNRALSGFFGPELEYHASADWMISGMAAIAVISPEEGDTQNVIILAGGAFKRLAGSENTAFMLGGRLVLGFVDEDGSRTQFNLEVPVRAQIWLSSMLALHAETGLVIAFVPDEGPVLGPNLAGVGDSTVIQLGAGGLFGAAGVTIYWP